MTGTLSRFLGIMERMGSDVIFHREDGGSPCPCRTPEGFRDPAWHRAHPAAQKCNEQGFIGGVTEFHFKGQVQPPRRRGNLGAQRVDSLLGEVEADDRIGIFPCTWEGHTLDFTDWSDAGEDFILYDGRRYMAVSSDKVPDVDGNPNHHWEIGLRLLKTERPTN